MDELTEKQIQKILAQLEGKRILAIDYGTKRIGIAVSDPMLIGARPLQTLPQDGKQWEKISAICLEYGIGCIVVGYPYWDRGRESKMAQLVRQFARALARKIPLPIYFFDESWTTRSAEKLVRTQKVKKQTVDAGIDALSAAILLDQVLEMVHFYKRKFSYDNETP